MEKLINTDKLVKALKELKKVKNCNAIYINDLIRIFNEAPAIETIPKDQYKVRLKADMVATLKELQLEIEETVKEEELIDKNWANGLHYSEKIIQQKIDKLKG